MTAPPDPALVHTALRTWAREWRAFFAELRYYRAPRFLAADLLLWLLYLPRNAYVVSRRFLEARGEHDVHRYGETPLRVLEQIIARCSLRPGARFFELGCGRGRTCFWAHCVAGLTTFGIDYVPTFIEQAERVKRRLFRHNPNLRFFHADIRAVDYSSADLVYLYGTGFDENLIGDWLVEMNDLPVGAWVVCASYALTDWPQAAYLQLVEQFEVDYTWGRTHVFVHRRLPATDPPAAAITD